jgi:O-methyltransferase
VGWRNRFFRALRRLRGTPGIDPLAEELYFGTLSAGDRRIVERALPYSVTGVPRLLALIEAVRHCVRADVPGGFAECGVWRGGSVVAMILALKDSGVERDVYLFDTFGPMPYMGEGDTSPVYESGQTGWSRSGPAIKADLWETEDAVRETIAATGYPDHLVHFVVGRVEDTLPEHAPERLALLRLDTDFYESTRHELIHLYPRLSPGGVLILDDYGEWEGARRAVDEYLAEEAGPLMLSPIDYTGRLAVKR